MRGKTIVRRSFIILLAGAQMQCLTLFRNNHYQTLELKSNPAGASVMILGNGKVLYRGKTPAKLEVRKANGYMVRIEKSGYRPFARRVRTEADPLLVLLSFLGFVPGMLVDLATGASSKIHPDRFDVNLVKFPSARAAPKGNPAEEKRSPNTD